MTNNEAPVETKPKLAMSQKTYENLKFVALVLLPALSTLYFTLGSVWGLPAVTQVIGTIAAVDTFLGVILGLSTKAYQASDARFGGNINIMPKDDGGLLYSLDLNYPVEDLDNKGEVTFKIVPPVS
jgi:Putative phage holin Dp-1